MVWIISFLSFTPMNLFESVIQNLQVQIGDLSITLHKYSDYHYNDLFDHFPKLFP